MRGTSFWSILLLVLAGLPSVGRAQSFTGTGQQATGLFPLSEGLAVFELTHQGDSRFVVQLLDADGNTVGELARASGRFDGSRALRIGHAGQYLLDVTASGPWTVKLREGTTGAAAPTVAETTTPASLAEGRAAGIAAAGRGSTAWGMRGLLGGTLAGPIGLGVAVHYAGTADVQAPTPPAAADALFIQGFREGFETRARANRRKSAFVGGMVGTAIFTTALIYLLDITGSGGGARVPDGGGPALGIAR
ncbi:MAG: hypothetical protein ACYC2G_16510 [Gemmatimonadaceae bacterium]